MIDINFQELEKRLRKLLRGVKWPVSVEYIFEQIKSDFWKFEEENVYSPLKIYQDGQRLFHPAESIQKWFTVEIINSSTIRAIFDDREEKILAQSITDEAKIQSNLINPYHEAKQQIKNVLDGMKDVQKVGSLYALETYFFHFPLDRVSHASALEKYISVCQAFDEDGNKREALSQLCKLLNFDALYYIVSINNLSSILEKGILCRNLSPSTHESFANEDIQAYRHQIVPCPEIGFTLHDYAPLFFTERPPLLTRNRFYPGSAVKIVISPIVLLEPCAIFFDINARSPKATCFTDIGELPNLNWNIIHQPWYGSTTWECEQIEYLYRQAEADIPLRILAKYFKEFVVYNEFNSILSIINILQGSFDKVRIDNNFYGDAV